MFSPRIANRIAVTTVAACLLSFAAFAPAQTESTKVAVCSPARVFNDMQETKDLRSKIEAQQKDFKSQADARQQHVKDLQAQRDLLKVDSPQYKAADDSFTKEAIEFNTWIQVNQAQMQGEQKQQMKSLFDKIVATTDEVAKAKGIDLVLTDQRPDLPENLTQISVEQLKGILNQRNILSMNEKKVDISQDVIAALDAKYKSSNPTAAAGGAGGAAPAPAPAAGK
jgi:Skp family chaperone for outer membrane proteins